MRLIINSKTSDEIHDAPGEYTGYTCHFYSRRIPKGRIPKDHVVALYVEIYFDLDEPVIVLDGTVEGSEGNNLSILVTVGTS